MTKQIDPMYASNPTVMVLAQGAPATDQDQNQGRPLLRKPTREVVSSREAILRIRAASPMWANDALAPEHDPRGDPDSDEGLDDAAVSWLKQDEATVEDEAHHQHLRGLPEMVMDLCRRGILPGFIRHRGGFARVRPSALARRSVYDAMVANRPMTLPAERPKTADRLFAWAGYGPENNGVEARGRVEFFADDVEQACQPIQPVQPAVETMPVVTLDTAVSGAETKRRGRPPHVSAPYKAVQRHFFYVEPHPEIGDALELRDQTDAFLIRAGRPDLIPVDEGTRTDSSHAVWAEIRNSAQLKVPAAAPVVKHRPTVVKSN